MTVHPASGHDRAGDRAGDRADDRAEDRAVDASITAWRQQLATGLLLLLGGVGLLALLFFAPLLVEARAWPLLAGSVVQNGLSLVLARRRDWPLHVRVNWAVANLLLTGVLALLVGGDSGVASCFLLGAVVLAALLQGWRTAAVVSVLTLVAFVGAALGQTGGVVPLSPVIGDYVRSGRSVAGVGLVAGGIAALAVVAIELTFRKVRAIVKTERTAFREREAAQRDRERTLRELVDAQAERRSLSATLSEALDALGAGYVDVDLADGSHRWSDGMFALLGYAPGSVTPSAALWRERLGDDGAARLLAAPAERSTSVLRIQLPDGTPRCLRATAHAVTDEDGVRRLRAIFTDVTAERATARHLARLAEVGARTANAVVVTDLEGRIEWVNDGFTRLTGWRLDEVLGRRPGGLLQGAHTDPAVRAHMARAIAARQDFDCEVLNYARDGRQYWVQIEARVAFDDEGAAIGYIAIETDVTERRIAAQRNNLAQRIAALLLASDTIEDVAPRVAADLVTELDIRTAQLWRVEPGRKELAYLAGAAATVSGPAGQAFLDRTRATSFIEGKEIVVGVGVPGTAWGTRRTVTVTRLADVKSRRLENANAAGVVTFCAAPILGVDGVLGVIEIGGSAFYPGHQLLPETLERVAEQLASFLRHDTSRRAFQAVFEHSPDPLLLVDDGGRVHGANARAGRVFGDPVGVDVERLLQGGRATIEGARASGPDSGARLLHSAAHGAAGPFSAELSIAAAPPSTNLGAIVAVRDLTERYAMEAALTRSLREKDTLLREVHHRVKNNLQIVSSLLTLQAEGLQDGTARAALGDTVFRVRSMSYVHQQLYGTDHLDAVDLGDYARTLCVALQGSLDPRATLSFDLHRVEIAIDDAVPCGLILNELITNALKHGRSPDGACRLAVSVRPEGDDVVVVVADQGPGLQTAAPAPSSLGMQLVRSLTRQLRGRLEYAAESGTRATLRVPARRPAAAAAAPAAAAPAAATTASAAATATAATTA
jgi:PAS domain S-box-containing protein